MLKYCLILSAVLFSTLSYGQKAHIFHRAYPTFGSNGLDPDTSFINLGGAQLKDENYVALDGMIVAGDTTIEYFVITNYDPKGKINWNHKIEVSGLNGQPGLSSIYQGTDDRINFSISLLDGKYKNLIGSLNKRGADLTMKGYDNDSDEVYLETPNNFILECPFDTLQRQLLNYNDGENNLLLFNKVAKNGDLLSSINYTFKDTTDLDYSVSAFDFEKDNNDFITTGAAVDASGNGLPEVFFSKIGINDKLYLNRTYTSEEALYIPLLGGTRVARSGKDYIIAGQFIDLDFSFIDIYAGSFVMKVDSAGNIKWSKVLDKNISPINTINGLAVTSKGDVIIGGGVLDNSGTLLKPYIVSLGSDGNQNWYKSYERADVNFNIFGKMFPTLDNGFAFLYGDVEVNNGNLTRPGFIKINSNGETGCEVKKDETLFIDHKFSSDTLVSKTEVIAAKYEKVPARVAGEVNFDVPVLELNVRPFCPNEPIDWTFEAKVKDAVKWEWSDKSTADTLRVFKTGQYSVTVTIDGEHCFMLCDTATLERTDLPAVQALSGPKVCVGAPFIVTSSSSSASPLTSKWNNGDINVGSITVSQLGTYSITITDQCGDTASSSITINEDIYFKAPAASVARGPQVCINTNFTIAAAGAGGGGGPYKFKWEPGGEETSIINKSVLGTYTVTVTDKCGLTATQSINVNNDVWLGPPSAALGNGEPVCKDTKFLIGAAGSGGGNGPYQFLWNTTETTANIFPDKVGLYSVTVTDNCGLTNTASKVIGTEIWLPPPSVTIDKSENNTFCQTGKIGLVANASGRLPITYAWGNATTTSEISVDGNGSYSVTVTDGCKLTNKADYEVKDAESGSMCLRYPKAFMPDAITFEGNKIFSAINQCGPDSAQVNGFVLKVYNRFGQEVFSSIDPAKGWDGKNESGDSFSPDVYVWYSRYSVGKFCKNETKGDVTLVR